MPRFVTATLVALIVTPLGAAEHSVTDSAIRDAIERARPLIERSAVEFTKQRECFSCHHQALPTLTLIRLSERGLAIDPSALRSQTDRTVQFLTRNLDGYRQGRGQGGQVDTAGYALWSLAVGGHAVDDLTEAVCHYIMSRQKDAGHWPHTSQRPPSEASDVTTTFLAIQALRRFASDAQQQEVQRRLQRARKWLLDEPAKDTEDLVFRLRALEACGADRETVVQAARDLLQRQGDAGAWAQLPDQDADAYATGSALVALRETDTLKAGDQRYRRAVAWLLERQRDDGSWHVATRSKPIQQYFESGFPHGEDQFISMAATCWSTLALALCLPPKAIPIPTPPGEASDESPQSEVLDVLQQQATAWNSGDLEAFMGTYWKSEKLSFSAAGKTIRGWQATFDRYRRQYPTKEKMGRLRFSAIQTTRLGESAVLVLGNWQLQREDGSTAGNFTLVLRRIDDRWQIIHDHTSAAETATERPQRVMP